MSYSYTNTLPTDRDWVRFLLSDTNSTSYALEDEEIDAVIAEQNQSVAAAIKYLAAAQCLSILHTEWMSKGKGVASKRVSQLAIVYGTGGNINVDLAMQEKIHDLRRRAASLLAKRPYIFRTVRES